MKKKYYMKRKKKKKTKVLGANKFGYKQLRVWQLTISVFRELAFAAVYIFQFQKMNEQIVKNARDSIIRIYKNNSNIIRGSFN